MNIASPLFYQYQSNMVRIVSFGLLIILQVVTAQPPPQCRSLPAGITNPGQCCDLKRVFKEEEFKECGIDEPSEENKDMTSASPDCPKQKCLFKKYNLMKDDDIDKDAIAEHLDKWVETNPDYADAVEKTKEICLNSVQPIPSKLCKPSWLLFCMREIMFMECPKWKDSDDCKKFKDFIEECKPHFYH